MEKMQMVESVGKLFFEDPAFLTAKNEQYNMFLKVPYYATLTLPLFCNSNMSLDSRWEKSIGYFFCLLLFFRRKLLKHTVLEKIALRDVRKGTDNSPTVVAIPQGNCLFYPLKNRSAKTERFWRTQ